MSKKKIDITSSIRSSDNFLNAGKGAALTQDLGSLLSGENSSISERNTIAVNKIFDNPFQPRLEIKKEALKELADSIESEGLLQAIVVQKQKNDTYVVIAGHRRLAAHKFLNKKFISATIVETPYSDTVVNNQLLFRQATIENIQRENLYPLELALACKEAIDKGLYKSVSDISQAINKSQTYLSKTMSVLKLSKLIIKDLSENKSVKDLEVLYELQKIKDEALQVKLYNQFKDKLINREDIRVTIKKQKTTVKLNPIKFKLSDSKISLNVDLTKLDSKKAYDLKTKIELLMQEYV